LDGFVYFENAEAPSLKIAVPFAVSGPQAAGKFAFRAADLIGSSPVVRLKAYVKAKSTAYRVVPDTVRLSVDRRGPLKWALDVDFAGDTSLSAFTGLPDASNPPAPREASVISRMQGLVSGKVIGFDPDLEQDTLYFRNMIYPELFANAPLRGDGAFGFDAFDLVGSLDGLHSLRIFLKPKEDRKMEPDTLRVNVSVP
jgi:hypothetical protein